MLSLYILTAHMVGDFLFQTHKMSQDKLKNWKVRFLHVSIYTAVFAIFLPLMSSNVDRFWFLLSIWVSHFMLDSIKWTPNAPWKAKSILIDQTLHLMTLAVICGKFLE